MAKFTKSQQRQKILHAKDLFIKGFDYMTIADILGISENTLQKWGRENDFAVARQASFIALSELRSIILQSFADLKDGKVPKITPD
ncbi:MAG: helix-turn-helix domain-containing protein, partial [Bacteroidota bacterium]